MADSMAGRASLRARQGAEVMKILDRHLRNAVLSGIGITMFVLLSLFAFFAFVDELADVGKGQYGVWQAMQYVALRLVNLTYQLFPVAALLGCIIGLGALATHGELVAIRAAGVSLRRIVWSVLKVGAVVMAISVLVGEGLTPVTERYAQRLRTDAISGNIRLQDEQGLWARDGGRFVHIKDIYALDHLGFVTIYEVNPLNQIENIITARDALFRDGHWLLQDVAIQRFETDTVRTESMEMLNWDSLLTPELLDVVSIKPESQPLPELYRYVRYLKSNALSSGRYEMAFWTKLVVPFVTAIMMVLAIPFVFGPLRSVGIGQRILVGALAGLGFHLFSQMINYAGLVYSLNPAVTATVPAIVFMFVAIWLLRRVR